MVSFRTIAGERPQRTRIPTSPPPPSTRVRKKGTDWDPSQDRFVLCCAPFSTEKRDTTSQKSFQWGLGDGGEGVPSPGPKHRVGTDCRLGQNGTVPLSHIGGRARGWGCTLGGWGHLSTRHRFGSRRWYRRREVPSVAWSRSLVPRRGTGC